MRKIITTAFIFLSTLSFAQTVKVGKEFNLIAAPIKAQLYVYRGDVLNLNRILEDAFNGTPDQDVNFKLLGSGTHLIEVKDYKNETVVIVGITPGFVPSVVQYQYDKDLKKEVREVTQKNTTRFFQLAVEPYDAVAYIDGEEASDNYPITIFVPENTSKNIEVKKAGFMVANEVYYNQPEKPVPPVGLTTITLETRVVHLETKPATGTFIWSQGNVIGEGNALVSIPKGECVVIQIRKDGFAEKEKTYCNKDGSAKPPLSDKITLEDREVIVRAPEGSTISVNGKKVGTAEYTIRITKGSMVKLTISKKGFVPYSVNLSNKDNEVPPPPVIVIEEGSLQMPEDESWTASSESDIANTDFILSIPEGMSEDDAWKIVAQIIQTYFDELEQIDKETGYMRTAWVYKRYANRTVRTRVIVKINNRSPLKYSLKISSEENGDAQSLDSRDDDHFSAWERVLNKYKDIISESQARLK